MVVYLLLWYVGNYYFNIFNKAAGIASGGAAFAFTLASLQLVIGSGWVVSLWVLGLRQRPALSASQALRLLPLGLVTAVAHGSAIYANLAGSLSFSQIVKAGEPAFAAAVGYGVYRNGVSWRKLLCLVPVIGGIAIASATELDYTLASFAAVSLANLAAAFRGCENKRVMAGELQSALGGEGNAYGVTTLWAAALLPPALHGLVALISHPVSRPPCSCCPRSSPRESTRRSAARALWHPSARRVPDVSARRVREAERFFRAVARGRGGGRRPAALDAKYTRNVRHSGLQQ